MYLREPDYDDIISLDYRKKSAVRTALENLIQEESHADGKDEHFATLKRSCVPITISFYVDTDFHALFLSVLT